MKGFHVLTATTYRGIRLERIQLEGRWAELWKIQDKEFSWNDGLAYIDTLHSEPPPPSHFCAECGERELLQWGSDIAKTLSSKQLCFGCNFWVEVIEEMKQSKFIVYDGAQAYTVAEEDAKGMRGYGGSKFTLTYEDGSEIVTTNLWCRGIVPSHFRGRMLNRVQRS